MVYIKCLKLLYIVLHSQVSINKTKLISTATKYINTSIYNLSLKPLNDMSLQIPILKY